MAATLATIWAVFPLSRAPESPFGLRANTRANAYLVLHCAASRMVASAPVVGVGPGRFGAELKRHSAGGERAAAWPPVRTNVDWDPHSTWLGIAAETGFVGLACWLVFLGWVLRSLWRDEPLGLGRLASYALLGILLNGSHVTLVHLKFIWVFLGIALGASHRPELRHDTVP